MDLELKTIPGLRSKSVQQTLLGLLLGKTLNDPRPSVKQKRLFRTRLDKEHRKDDHAL